MTSATSDYLLVTDYLDAPLIGRSATSRRGGAIQQPGEPFGPVAGQPLARGPVTDSGRLGGLRQRPPRVFNALPRSSSALDVEPGVTVQLHPVSSLGTDRLAALSLQGAPDG